MPAFLITLATGVQGTAIAHELRQAGHQVHAFVRDRHAPRAVSLENIGVKVFQGSLDDGAAIKEAATGVTGIFWNLPTITKDPSIEWPHQTETMLQAARETGTVTTIVFSTAFYTGKHPEWVARNPNYVSAYYYDAKYRCEQIVLKSGFPYITILRPSWLMHNYIAPYAPVHYPELATEQTYVSAYKPDTRMPQCAPEDVGKFAAAAFLHPEKYSGKQIELGNENLTIAEASAIISRVAGVETKLRRRNSEEIKEAQSRIPTQQFQIMANEKDMTIDPSSLSEYGIRMIPLEEYLTKEREALRRALGVVG
jgi:uncharacterized protein YbjT (DUF2867 family)